MGKHYAISLYYLAICWGKAGTIFQLIHSVWETSILSRYLFSLNFLSVTIPINLFILYERLTVCGGMIE